MLIRILLKINANKDTLLSIFITTFSLVKMRDTTKHQGLRNQLANVLEAKGITDEQVLKAIRKIPRHLFIDSSFEAHAYQDKAFPIAAQQTISQPYTVAFQSQVLEILPNEKVLEIGTGSGYQTAVLLELEAEVYTIERQHELFKKTSLFLPKIGYKPKRFIFGDGYIGLKEQAPFDKIIVTAGAPFVPKALLAQLKVGGRLLIPVGDETQMMTLFIRKSVKEFEKHELGDFKFVPMLEKKN
ncbi:protein-L-isoaspartate(D-aspartate) O-methyltransferase [Tenacibaculum adriaticum]|uniref:Protein-L-isoaspartate O-methyltransferase n=2 Tax=Tenacibaculum adriaticum TaxID=413713 RepID=A0A5S5DS79_9FLAO|nr:protein-L-isoaspartate(D-aspartate) O-methyltransferase [Tenacibaculum adriaticum]